MDVTELQARPSPIEGTAQGPAEVADELAAADANATELPPALREEQIQNAVAFLAHPKVKSSSKESKRSFLERKGLTGPEIEEAFTRVPESSTAVVVAAPSAPGGAPRKPFPTGQALQPVAYVSPPPPQQQPYRWTQVVIGASVLMAGAYALKQMVGPYAVSWYRKFYGLPEGPEEETRKSDDSSTAELISAAITSQNTELRETLESLKDVVLRLEKGKQLALPPPEPSLSVSDLREELHAFALTLSSVSPSKPDSSEVSEQLKELKSLISERISSAAQNPSAPAYPAYSSGDIPNGGSSVAPPAARFPYRSSEAGNGNPSSAGNPPSSNPTKPQSQQPSYQEVMEMLERGETPPNVRTDINDKPPNPAVSPPTARMQPRPKPWDRTPSPRSESNGHQAGSTAPGVTAADSDDSPTPAPANLGAWKPPPVPQPSLRAAAAPESSETSRKEPAATGPESSKTRSEEQAAAGSESSEIRRGEQSDSE